MKDYLFSVNYEAFVSGTYQPFFSACPNSGIFDCGIFFKFRMNFLNNHTNSLCAVHPEYNPGAKKMPDMYWSSISLIRNTQFQSQPDTDELFKFILGDSKRMLARHEVQ